MKREYSGRKYKSYFTVRVIVASQKGLDLTQHTESLLGVLATRVVHTGCMLYAKLSVVSNLVSKGLCKNLMGDTADIATSRQYANILPDPICARLAMCMMDENGALLEY
jgi:hypothetical protein